MPPFESETKVTSPLLLEVACVKLYKILPPPPAPLKYSPFVLSLRVNDTALPPVVLTRPVPIICVVVNCIVPPLPAPQQFTISVLPPLPLYASLPLAKTPPFIVIVLFSPVVIK